jgi:hypothetical protein
MTWCPGFVQSCSWQFTRSHLEILQARLDKHNQKSYSLMYGLVNLDKTTCVSVCFSLPKPKSVMKLWYNWRGLWSRVLKQNII